MKVRYTHKSSSLHHHLRVRQEQADTASDARHPLRAAPNHSIIKRQFSSSAQQALRQRGAEQPLVQNVKGWARRYPLISAMTSLGSSLA
mmetsp:Transcript_12137/g.28338  ORF Transcript_12137/g.28338 Transcript_12137/m.28338 type:complete len:89 (+) Transcript_12137:61-327(+)